MSQQRGFLFFLAVTIGSFMVGVDFLAVGVAVEPMAKELNIGMSTIQWFLSAFAIGDSCFLVAAGKLCDIWGVRKVMNLGILFFIFSSLLIACVSQPWLIVVGRTFQGISAGFMVTASVASVMCLVPEKKRTAWTALLVGTGASGMVLGPLLGGYLIHLESWRLVFLINLPVGLLGLFFVFMAIPAKAKTHREKRSVDVKGIVLLGATLFSLNTLLSRGHYWGWLSVHVLVFLILTLLFLLCFVFHEKRFSSPIVEFAMFRVKNFLSANLVGFLIYFVIISWILLYSIYLQRVAGFSVIQAGEMFVPYGLMVVIISPFAGKIADKLGVRSVILFAAFVAAIAFLMMALMPINPPPFWLALSFLLFGLGFVFINAVSITAALAFLKGAKMGVGSGKTMMMRWLGGAVGVSIVTTIFVQSGLAKLSDLLAHYPAFNTPRVLPVLKALFNNQHPENARAILGSHWKSATQVLNMAMHHGLQVSLWVLMSLCVLIMLVAFFFIKEKK